MDESGCQNTPQDPREEVKKLQELVRQLEHQNQQLRNKQQVEENAPSKSCKDSATAIPAVHVPRTPLRPLDSRLNPNGVECEDGRDPNRSSTGAEKREPRKSGILDDVDLINIEDLDISDEDSWLYISPKGLSTEERSVSPYKWLRKDVEDPHNRELQLARRALAYKLDESAILSSHRSAEPPSLSLSLLGKPPIGRVIDSRTFTRGKKKRTPLEQGSDSLSVIESLKDEDEYEEENQTDSGSYVAPLRSTEVIDVQEIARMQEETGKESVCPERRS